MIQTILQKTLSHVEKGKIILENTTKTYAGMRDVPILNILVDFKNYARMQILEYILKKRSKSRKKNKKNLPMRYKNE